MQHDHDRLLAGYERWMRSWDASDKTVEARITQARRRLREWGVEGFTPTNVQDYLGAPGWSRWTRATYYANVKNFCEYLVAAGALAESPMEDVRRVSRPRSLPKPLTDTEMALVLDAARRHTDTRIIAWLILARRAGLRCHEIAKFAGEDLTPRGLYVFGKGGKEAVLPVHPDIAILAKQYPVQGYWFPSRQGAHLQPDTVSGTVSAFFSAHGIKGSIHRVRHNFGTDLVEGGNDLRVVQELMRHSSLATTEGYTLVSAGRLAAAIGRLPAA
jgi:site-specific recombinase XerD